MMYINAGILPSKKKIFRVNKIIIYYESCISGRGNDKNFNYTSQIRSPFFQRDDSIKNVNIHCTVYA